MHAFYFETILSTITTLTSYDSSSNRVTRMRVNNVEVEYPRARAANSKVRGPEILSNFNGTTIGRAVGKILEYMPSRLLEIAILELLL